MNPLEKYLNYSKNNRAVIIGDSNCELCIRSMRFASNLLRENSIVNQQFTYKAVFGREVEKGDEFLFLYAGKVYKSHEAWVKIFTLSKFPWKLAKYANNKLGMCLVMWCYTLVSKYRKLFFKKKCNC